MTPLHGKIERRPRPEAWYSAEKRLRYITRRMFDRLISFRANRLYRRFPVRINMASCPFMGCNCAEFEKHLESQFRDGMTWKNYGMVWEIDHIKPVSTFDLVDENQFRECASYKNTRPLFCEENHPWLLAPKGEPRLVIKNGKPQWMVDLRFEGKGRVFAGTESEALEKKRAALAGEEFKKPEPIPLTGGNQPVQIIKNGRQVWMLDLRSFGLGRKFAKTREALLARCS